MEELVHGKAEVKVVESFQRSSATWLPEGATRLCSVARKFP